MSKRVLVIDDDELYCKLFVEILRIRDYFADSLRQAIRWEETINIKRPDLLILDANLPEISGFDIARNIREHKSIAISSLPVILVTAYPDTDRIQKMADELNILYLSKPISVPHFLETVKSLIGE